MHNFNYTQVNCIAVNIGDSEIKFSANKNTWFSE